MVLLARARHAAVIAALLATAGWLDKYTILIFFGYTETDVDDHE